MGKDLRTLPIDLKLGRLPKLETEVWGLQKPQPFFPSLEHLFKTEQLGAIMEEFGIKHPDGIEYIVNPDTIWTRDGKEVNVHRKTTMILSPFKTMKGEYGHPGLPKSSEVAKDISDRLQNQHTAAYVGALTASVLASCPLFPKVYGVLVSLAKTFVLDISDDYEEIAERKWFLDNVGKTFDLKVRAPTESSFTHTRGQRASIVLGDNVDLDFEDAAADEITGEPANVVAVEEYLLEKEESEEDISDDESDVFDIESCKCEDEDEEADDEEGEDEPFAWVTFKDVPVVTTVMETCAGSFYDLIESDSNPEHHTAWMAQIVLALAYAQRTIGFTHNDLHGNNVMYVDTTDEFVFAKHAGLCYRVPTFGKQIKIIDFDRAIVSIRLPGMKEARTFASSQFQTDEEACGQYNHEPYLVHDKPRIPPNASFDLARFATSVFWDMFPEGPDHAYDHPLFDMMKAWMTCPDGSSVLYRETHDNHDRYHGFDLYKAIARFCTNAVPKKELSRFRQYYVSAIPIGVPFFSIDL
jgi:hypothetical protein